MNKFIQITLNNLVLGRAIHLTTRPVLSGRICLTTKYQVREYALDELGLGLICYILFGL
jgi:hypothetical protein